MNGILALSSLEAGLFVFVMGLLVVFFGITVIVLVVSVIGRIMKMKKEKPTKEVVPTETAVAPQAATDDEEARRVHAAITAVIAAYYFDQGSNCQFKIKKIKKL